MNQTRRNFLSLFGAGVAGIALEQAIPAGRVWSFPKEIVIAPPRLYNNFLTTEWITMECLRMLKNQLTVDGFPEEEFVRAWNVGNSARFRAPHPYMLEVPYNFGKLFPDDVTPDVIFTAAFPPGNSRRPS